MSAKRSEHEFTVRIEGLDIDDASVNRLNNVVQKALLAEFARMDFMTDDIMIRFPKEWLGIWIRNAKLGQFDR